MESHKYAYTFVINKINDDVPQWKADFGTYDNIKDGDVEYFDLELKLLILTVLQLIFRPLLMHPQHRINVQ